MRIPRPLALPHLVQHCDDDPRRIADALIDSAKNRPNFSYKNVDPVLMSFMRGNFPRSGLERGLKNAAPKGREKLFSELTEPLYEVFRCRRRPKAIVTVERRELTIPIRGGLVVPFDPGFVYVPAGSERIILPFRLYWKNRSLNERSIQLFFSLARELMLEDDNMADAELELITMPLGSGGGRELKVYRYTQFEELDVSSLNEFLAIYAEGYSIACEEATRLPSRPRSPRQRPPNPSLPLFDEY